MNARMITEQVVDRSRSIWRMAEHQERDVIKSALLDITLDTAMDVANRSMQLVEQYECAGAARRLRVMRELLTLWRKLVRNVKAVNADHPIHECHLYVVMLDAWGSRLNAYEKLFDSNVCVEVKQLYYERQGLRPGSRDALDGQDLRTRKLQARSRVKEVLSTYYAAQ